MMLATRPDPTVLPPSRTFAPEIIMFLGDFKSIFNTFFLDIHLVSEVFEFFVIMVLSQGELYTICFSKYPELGKPNRPLIEYLCAQQKSGNKLILWTYRAGETLEKAVS